MDTKETLEEAAEKWYDSTEENKGFPKIQAFKDGAKWQQERSYSEEEVIKFLQQYRYDLSSKETPNLGDTTSQWFKQYKK